jgi:hypothetical protein
MVGLLVVFASIATVVGASLAARSARLRVIEEAFRSLGGDPRRTLRGVEGPVHGLPVRYSFTAGTRRVAKGSLWRNTRSTICVATLSVERPPFEMDLRPESRWGQRDVEHGRAIDLVLGDEAFDDSFLVEAAPADMARALIDRDTRTALLSFHPCRLTAVGGELRFTKTAMLDEFAEVRRVLELCTRVRSRLESLPALAAEERLALAREGAAAGGYRGPGPHEITALGSSSASAAEVAALQHMRMRRTMLRAAQGASLVALGIVVWLLLNARCMR